MLDELEKGTQITTEEQQSLMLRSERKTASGSGAGEEAYLLRLFVAKVTPRFQTINGDNCLCAWRAIAVRTKVVPFPPARGHGDID